MYVEIERIGHLIMDEKLKEIAQVFFRLDFIIRYYPVR